MRGQGLKSDFIFRSRQVVVCSKSNLEVLRFRSNQDFSGGHATRLCAVGKATVASGPEPAKPDGTGLSGRLVAGAD